MFYLQLLILFLFTLKLSMSASYLINVQLLEGEEQEENSDEIQPKQSEFFKSVAPLGNLKNGKMQGKYLKKAKIGKANEDDRKLGDGAIQAYGLKRRSGKLAKEHGSPDSIELWTENAAFYVRIGFFMANLTAIMFAVNVFEV